MGVIPNIARERFLYSDISPLSPSSFNYYEYFKSIGAIVSYDGDDPALTGRYPQQGWVCNFDGVDDYVILPITPNGLLTGRARFKLDTGALSTARYIICSNITIGDGLVRVNSNGTLQVASLAASLIHPVVVSENEWHEIEWSIGGGVATSLTLDGVTETGSTSTLGQTNTSYVLGKLYNNNYCFKGVMSDITVNGSQYNLDHKSGTVAYDSSGNSNHGTLMNGAAFVVDNTLPYSRLNQLGYSNAQNLLHFSQLYDTITGGFTGATSLDVSLVGNYTKLTRTTVSGSQYKSDSVSDVTLGMDYMLEFTIKCGTQGPGEVNVGTLQGGVWYGDYIEIVSGSGVIESSSGLYKVTGLDQNDTTIRCKLPSVTALNVYLYPMGTSTGTVGDECYIKNNMHLWEGDENTPKPAYTPTAPVAHTLDAGIRSVLLPPDASNPGYDVLGNDLQFSGSVYQVQPVRRQSFCGVFDGVDDYITCGTFTIPSNATWRVDALIRINTFANFIIPFSLGNWLNGAGCLIYVDKKIRAFSKGVSAGAVSVGLVAGEWFELSFGNDGSETFVEVDGVRVFADTIIEQSAELTDACLLGDNNLAGKAFDIAHIKFNINSVEQFHYTFSEGYGTTVYDVSGNGNHGTIYNATTSPQGTGFWAGRQDAFHYNLEGGFSFDGDARIPALADGSGNAADGSGALTNPSVYPNHNDAETVDDVRAISEDGNPVPETYSLHSDAESIEFSDSNATLQAITPTESIFRRDSSSTEKDRLVTFEDSLTGGDLTKAQSYTS